MTTNGDKLAYPMSADDERSTGIDGWGERGMTKREAFAMAALSVLSSDHPQAPTVPAEVADYAVRVADALLAELAKEPTHG